MDLKDIILSPISKEELIEELSEKVVLAIMSKISFNQDSKFNKPFLNFNEACEYVGCTKSLMYKYTANNEITHYKPNNKKVYFKRQDLDVWLLRNKVMSREEIAREATKMMMK